MQTLTLNKLIAQPPTTRRATHRRPTEWINHSTESHDVLHYVNSWSSFNEFHIHTKLETTTMLRRNSFSFQMLLDQPSDSIRFDSTRCSCTTIDHNTYIPYRAPHFVSCARKIDSDQIECYCEAGDLFRTAPASCARQYSSLRINNSVGGKKRECISAVHYWNMCGWWWKWNVLANGCGSFPVVLFSIFLRVQYQHFTYRSA